MAALSPLDTLALAEACNRYAGNADITVSSFDLPLDRGRVLLPAAFMARLAEGLTQVLDTPDVAGTQSAAALVPTVRNLQAALADRDGDDLEMRLDDYQAFTAVVLHFLDRYQPNPDDTWWARVEAATTALEASASIWIQEGKFLIHADDYGQMEPPVLANTYRGAEALFGELDLLQLYMDRIGMIEMAAVIDAARQHARHCGHLLDAAGRDAEAWLMGMPEDCAHLVAQAAAFQSLYDELLPDDQRAMGGDRAVAAFRDARDLAARLKTLPAVDDDQELVVHLPVAWWRRLLDGLAPFLADYRQAVPFTAADVEDYDRMVTDVRALLLAIPMQPIPEGV